MIGPYTIKGLDGKIMDFMCLSMIDPAVGWFEIIELPNVLRIEGGEFKVTEKVV